jgi:hypothetical protein
MSCATYRPLRVASWLLMAALSSLAAGCRDSQPEPAPQLVVMAAKAADCDALTRLGNYYGSTAVHVRSAVWMRRDGNRPNYRICDGTFELSFATITETFECAVMAATQSGMVDLYGLPKLIHSRGASPRKQFDLIGLKADVPRRISAFLTRANAAHCMDVLF